MTSNADQLQKLLRQQTTLAQFGSFALRESDLQKILTEAARVCAEGLSVPYCKVCRYRPEHNDLLIEAGFGWHAGVIGIVVSRADDSTPQGRAFVTGKPSICKDLSKDTSYQLPSLYAAHGIISTIDVVIKGSDNQPPYGILEIDSDRQHDYDQQDIDFLTGFANVLAEAVATASLIETLRLTVAQMKVMVDEKERLLAQKKVLAEELQHRVRNNLQLVHGMLSRQVEDSHGERGQRGIKAIARRVSTLAQVYEHLLGSEMTRTTDFGGYVKSLCGSLAEIQESQANVTLKCEIEPLMLDLDTVTALGIVVAEVVSNSYDHAFPTGSGAITVSLRGCDDDGMATITIRDDGIGFQPALGSKRHGLGLVRRLVEQVRGTVELKRDDGTLWTVRVPLVPDVLLTA